MSRTQRPGHLFSPPSGPPIIRSTSYSPAAHLCTQLTSRRAPRSNTPKTHLPAAHRESRHLECARLRNSAYISSLPQGPRRARARIVAPACPSSCQPARRRGDFRLRNSTFEAARPEGRGCSGSRFQGRLHAPAAGRHLWIFDSCPVIGGERPAAAGLSLGRRAPRGRSYMQIRPWPGRSRRPRSATFAMSRLFL